MEENLKKLFKEELKEINFRRFKVLLLTGGVIAYPLFGILDFIVVPELGPLFLKIRLFIAVFSFILLLASYIPYTKNTIKKLLLPAITTLLLLGAGGIALMIRFYGGYSSPYYAGLGLVLLVCSIAILAHPWHNLFLNITVILMYLLPSIAFDDIYDIRPLVSNTFFLCSTAFFGMVYSTINYFQQYRLFLLNHNIEQQNKKLMELDQLKSRFFNNITHELRTPLTLITTPLETILSQKETLPESTATQLEIMYTNALRLLKLINSVLDLHKIEAGKMKLNCRKDDFTKFIRYLTHTFESTATHKGLHLKFEEIQSIPEFPFDKDKIENIFVNLAFNAIKFTPSGGTIKVTVGKDNKYAYFTVEDTGIGIDKEKIPMIFDRFTQLDDSTKKAHSGTGIGLAIVKELVELHKGKIAVESEEGIGTRFTVYIPMDLEEDKSIEGHTESGKEDITKKISRKALYTSDSSITFEYRPPPSRSAEQDSRPTILVIDDNIEMLSVIEENLKSDYNVICINNSMDGLKFATENEPDIIISDLMMPQVDGVELCNLLRKNPKTNRIPFILLTAKADLSERIKSLYAGVDDYLFKPFHPAELKARISVMIRLKQTSDQLATKNTKLEELNTALQELAIKDPLTDVYNRRYLYDFLQNAISTHTTIGVIMLDIDHFKQYNDRNGHLPGDNAIKKVIKTISNVTGRESKIFRYGGEEFVILLPERNKVQAYEVAEEIRKAVEAERFEGEEKIDSKKLTVSLGVSTYPENGTDVDTLLRSADSALYKAKEKRNSVYII